VTDLDEIDAEIDRRRIEAQKRIVRSRKISKYGLLIFFAVVVVLPAIIIGRRFHGFTIKTGLTVLAVVAVTLALEAAARRLNALRGEPFSDFAISTVFLIVFLAVVSAVF
jgi:4-hydroxybenzoate polyprenyltransferase